MNNLRFKAKFLALSIFVQLPFGPVWVFAADKAVSEPADTLRVMTYNLRFASATGANAWPERGPLMHELIEKISPDLMGTQEGLHDQLMDIGNDLPGFSWIGVGRDDGRQAGEFMAIFYRKSRLEPLSTNYFWLSDTPEVAGSTTWGNKNRRMVTTVRFRDLQTRKEFYAMDTHFDHEVQLAREKSAELVREKVAELKTTLPILLIGDFNAGAGKNKAYHMLVYDKFFEDTWDLAKDKKGEGLGTFNGFKAVPQNGVRIDWILVKGKCIVLSEQIETFSKEGKFPSDHCPVIADVRLSE
jgi:endonuclease/exonuclease/phosphatase family metal-dependent hydrolase